jgi:hypothetical protein
MSGLCELFHLASSLPRQGVVGQQPGARALLAALAAHELFLFLGHGSGEQFLPLPALRKLQSCAAAVLMGCSSGRLRLHGAYDPAGAVVAYALAGGVFGSALAQRTCSLATLPTPAHPQMGLVLGVRNRSTRPLPHSQAARRLWRTCGTSLTAI